MSTTVGHLAAMHRSHFRTRLARLTVTFSILCIGCSDGRSTDLLVRQRTDAAPAHLAPLSVSDHDIPFGRIGAVLADRLGNIYIADVQAQEIVVLDSLGRLIRTIGRKGNGPGEFRALHSIAWMGDTLVTLDLRTRTITIFNLDGRPLSTAPWPQSAGRPLRLLTNGTSAYAVGTVSRSLSEAPVRTAAEGERVFRQPEVRYFHLRPDGAIGARIAVFDTLTEPRGFDCDGPNGYIAIFPTPLFGHAGPLRAFSSAGHFIIATQASYHLATLDPSSGDTLRTVDRTYAALPVTDRMWDAATREYYERERTEGPFGCDIEARRPAFLPVIRSLVSDDRDRLWVESMTAPDTFRLAAIDSAGRVLGEADLPARDDRVPFYVRDSTLYLVAADSIGVQVVHTYRIRFDQRMQ